ncbi:MAG TPA: CPBP family intramembrane glutamic endopeptidase [Streptosporangiaceae bacterium]|nr:CPBP family intramembrane glutamic endopeptidase [Streptosporangiaceae bacterium]
MSRRRDVTFIIVSSAALTAYNNVIGAQPWHHRWYTPANACAAAGALAAARASGLTPADLGLGRGAWRPGRLGSTLAAATVAGYLTAAVLPATRRFLDDKRVTHLDRRGLLYQVAYRIPIGTVLWEEIAFRGVLQAALRRVLPEPATIAVASGVFGVWHIRPAVGALRINGLAGDRRQMTARVTAVVAVTAAGGALFSWLRARSGSLTTPVLLHLTTNCAGLLAAWALARIRAASRGC